MGSESMNTGLINYIVSSLRELEDGDADLTAILTEHLLTISPDHNAVEKASEEIARLAVVRAKESHD